MKIVLREHVDHLGSRGDVVSVAAGYARNYLLPKGLALLATPGNLKVLEHQRRIWQVKEAKEVEQAQGAAARLGELRLAVTHKAGESGTLYGSVTSSEVAELLAARGVEIDRRKIMIAEPIKSVGAHEISIKLHRDVVAKVQLEVSAEGAPEYGEDVIVETAPEVEDSDEDEDAE